MKRLVCTISFAVIILVLCFLVSSRNEAQVREMRRQQDRTSRPVANHAEETPEPGPLALLAAGAGVLLLVNLRNSRVK